MIGYCTHIIDVIQQCPQHAQMLTYWDGILWNLSQQFQHLIPIFDVVYADGA